MDNILDECHFVPDYGPLDGEIPDVQNKISAVTARSSKGRKCPSCPGRFTNVRRHVLRSHLPWYVSPTTACWQCKLQFGQESLLNGHIAELHNSVPEGRKFEGGEKYYLGGNDECASRHHQPKVRLQFPC